MLVGGDAADLRIMQVVTHLATRSAVLAEVGMQHIGPTAGVMAVVMAAVGE
jgi:hypothetical protein